MTKEDIYGKAAELIKKSKKTLVLTGAGISTESGIPDFRSPGTGLWEKMDPMEVLSTKVLYENPVEFYNNGFKILLSMKDAKPNKAHYILAQLEKEGLIHGVITQNIDNLHQKAGSHKVFEVHGQTRTGSCIRCGRVVSIDLLVSKVQENEIPPKCDNCNGILRSDVVLFGDPMPEDFERAWREAENSDLMIVIGSSLMISPVNFLPGLVKHLIIINRSETPEDKRSDVVIRESASQALDNILKCLK